MSHGLCYSLSEGNSVPLAFSESWQVLGPFQIGTREATWGADPLEYLGGFRSLEYNKNDKFTSSLPLEGAAKWSSVNGKQIASTPSSANVSLSISFPGVDWAFLKGVYGWAAVQYQAWVRGEIIVTSKETQSVVLYTDMVLEYWIDGVCYFGGDFYGFRKAPPVLHLEPGSHRIDVRLVRDMRAMGDMLDPTIDVILELNRTSGSLELVKPGILMADVVNSGKLASPIGSIYVRNSGTNDIEITGVQSGDADITLVNKDPKLVVVGGQTRPIALNIESLKRKFNPACIEDELPLSIEVELNYKVANLDGEVFTLTASQDLTIRNIFSPHKVTYLHPGAIVSYAILRPPVFSSTCLFGVRRSLPVLLQLHGAGLEADSEEVAHALDPVSDLCAWVLFPTGVTPWSADDWHNWGFADVEQAVRNIPSWMEAVGWRGPDADINRWVVSGHSNGGQGTWYSVTHRPDNIIAAAPVSGYSSIQRYVPYELWQPMDPRRSAIISASLNSYRHEMLMANAKGIPIFHQHGDKDDNVPVYHSRLLRQLLFQHGTKTSYYELPGQGHWFEGIMTTPQLQCFYRTYTSDVETTARPLEDFDIVVADPGDMGSKGGVKVLQLEDPGQYGQVQVIYDNSLKTCTIKTSNVLALQLQIGYFRLSAISIDGSALELAEDSAISSKLVDLTKDVEDQTWKVGSLQGSKSTDDILNRRGRQLGAMTAILRSTGPFTIRHQGNETAHIALQISRNLHQYFYADSSIVYPVSHEKNSPGNVISVAIGAALPRCAHSSFPIQVKEKSISIRDSVGRHKTFGGDQSLAAIFLRPLNGERLELVVWGSDSEGLSQAARLVPMLTGVGQPDFVVLTEAARWIGVEGAVTMGFLDHAWNVTRSSLV
ncbi:hypothetical protein GQ43DRAFT_274948 [Delitschia confertaspora ATCC 74209]|uniref:Peptidase S9 prolyl oligopeptidase catalytic domain-containing protein n=1 Tax=Delitschia confertaspora ATCC 74209 TaxID=1513339 RepID=A0A9P4JS00_9PLEO|nr:hypothetical protein GQ43DRAFT_274948 [Delitschia confertaspora ATCC 74209]